MSDIENQIEKTQSTVNRVRKRLDIKTETYAVMNDDHKHVKDMIFRCGLILKPETAVYLGSAVVHVYETVREGGREIQCITQAPFLKPIGEVQMGVALDELRRKLMSAYGRSPVGK